MTDVTIMFCLLHLCQNKKGKRNSKQNKEKEKKNGIKPSPSFTTLTINTATEDGPLSGLDLVYNIILDKFGRHRL